MSLSSRDGKKRKGERETGYLHDKPKDRTKRLQLDLSEIFDWTFPGVKETGFNGGTDEWILDFILRQMVCWFWRMLSSLLECPKKKRIPQYTQKPVVMQEMNILKSIANIVHSGFTDHHCRHSLPCCAWWVCCQQSRNCLIWSRKGVPPFGELERNTEEKNKGRADEAEI